jgi:membrane-associated protease RseP (regulator of RpoE activity)
MTLRVEGATPWTNRPGVVLGVRVTEVVDGGPAAKAGIAGGDLLVTVDGRDVRTAVQAGEAIAARRPGDTIEIGVADAGSGEVRKVTVTLAENPDREGAAYLGVRLGGPWLAPGIELPRLPDGRPFGGPGRTSPGRAAPGGIDA